MLVRVATINDVESIVDFVSKKRRLPEYVFTYKQLVLENDKLNGIMLNADNLNLPAHKTYQKSGMSPDHYITFEWFK